MIALLKHTSPTLACHLRRHATHATYASMDSTPFLKLVFGKIETLNLETLS